METSTKTYNNISTEKNLKWRCPHCHKDFDTKPALYQHFKNSPCRIFAVRILIRLASFSLPLPKPASCIYV